MVPAMVMNLQPTLTGTTLTLRPMSPADWAALFAVAADPEIWAIHPAHDRWQEPVFRRFFEDGLASGGSMVAVDNASGAIIGHSRYDLARVEPGEIEVGWSFLVRNRWGGAANREVKGLLVAHALKSFDRVMFMVGETNLRSRRAMEKIGGILTTRQQISELAGQPVVHVIYQIDRAGFVAGPLAGY
jgi:RimJ/RimL family protein N-acetyltransferase